MDSIYDTHSSRSSYDKTINGEIFKVYRDLMPYLFYRVCDLWMLVLHQLQHQDLYNFLYALKTHFDYSEIDYTHDFCRQIYQKISILHFEILSFNNHCWLQCRKASIPFCSSTSLLAANTQN